MPNIDFGISPQDSSFLEKRWLLRFHRDFYLPEDLTSDQLKQLVPPLDDEWLTPDPARLRRITSERDFSRRLLEPVDEDIYPSSDQREASPPPPFEEETAGDAGNSLQRDMPGGTNFSPSHDPTVMDNDDLIPTHTPLDDVPSQSPPPKLDSDLSYDALDPEPPQPETTNILPSDSSEDKHRPILRKPEPNQSSPEGKVYLTMLVLWG